MASTTIAKLIAVPSAFLLCGYSTSFSQNSMQTLINQTASVSTPAFTHIYYAGASIIAPVTAAAVLASSYLAYAKPEQRTLWAAAAMFTVGPLVFTRTVMYGGVYRLIEIGESAAEQEVAGWSGEVTRLMGTWVVQNWVRAAMTFSGGMLGFGAVLTEGA